MNRYNPTLGPSPAHNCGECGHSQLAENCPTQLALFQKTQTQLVMRAKEHPEQAPQLPDPLDLDPRSYMRFLAASHCGTKILQNECEMYIPLKTPADELFIATRDWETPPPTLTIVRD